MSRIMSSVRYYWKLQYLIFFDQDRVLCGTQHFYSVWYFYYDTFYIKVSSTVQSRYCAGSEMMKSSIIAGVIVNAPDETIWLVLV